MVYYWIFFCVCVFLLFILDLWFFDDFIWEWLGRVVKEVRERVLVWYVLLNVFKNSVGEYF